jgi:hypothetical protein
MLEARKTNVTSLPAAPQLVAVETLEVRKIKRGQDSSGS